MKLIKWLKFFFECETKLLFIFLSLFTVGYIWGAFSLFSYDVQAILNEDILFLYNGCFSELFFRNIIVLISVFFIGYSAIGLPFISFILIYNGVCFGIASQALLINYGLKSNIIVIIFLFLNFFVYFVSLSCVSFSSMRMSLALFNVFKNETRYVSPGFYSKPHIIKLLFYIVISVVNCVFTCLIFKLLNRLVF